MDDLSIATGRKKCHGDGPSGAHDVSNAARETTEGEEGVEGLRRTASSFISPYAHFPWYVLLSSAFILAHAICALAMYWAQALWQLRASLNTVIRNWSGAFISGVPHDHQVPRCDLCSTETYRLRCGWCSLRMCEECYYIGPCVCFFEGKDVDNNEIGEAGLSEPVVKHWSPYRRVGCSPLRQIVYVSCLLVWPLICSSAPLHLAQTLVAPSLSRQSSRCVAARPLIAQAKSGRVRERRPTPQSEFYDVSGHGRVPTAPWTSGDALQAGKVHVDIYCGGRRYGPIVNPVTGRPRVVDAFVTLDDRGTHPLRDPKDANHKVHGERVIPHHDGHCASLYAGPVSACGSLGGCGGGGS